MPHSSRTICVGDVCVTFVCETTRSVFSAQYRSRNAASLGSRLARSPVTGKDGVATRRFSCNYREEVASDPRKNRWN